MQTEQFNYYLPEELIAQHPVEPRDSARLLVLDRESGNIEDRIFRQITEYLQSGDLLVVNNTRVRPARLIGRKQGTQGTAEVSSINPPR